MFSPGQAADFGRSAGVDPAAPRMYRRFFRRKEPAGGKEPKGFFGKKRNKGFLQKRKPLFPEIEEAPAG